MNNNYYCVIMAGGIGTRFWPVSRTSQPKQFIDILGTGETLIQQTYRRFQKICKSENILIVTNDIYRDLVKTQLPDIKDHQILCEPTRRNTAPCIAYACHKIKTINPNAIVVVAPSDHIILKEDMFQEIILSGMQTAEHNNWLLTLGIKPSYPNTGYGYIQFDENNCCPNDNRIHKVKTFTEKPAYEMAVEFLNSGDFLWNAGIFIWSLNSILEAFEKFLPEVNSIFSEGASAYNTSGETDFIANVYPVCRNISIDYGIMEKADNVYTVLSDFGWSDLGTWGSVYETRIKNADGNTIVGKNVMTYDSKGCVVHVPKEKLVVLQGLEDYIVVEDNDILLVCKRSEEQQIRQFVHDVSMEKGEKFI